MPSRLAVNRLSLKQKILGSNPSSAAKNMDKTYSQKNSVYCIFGDSIAQAAYARNGWVELFKQFLEEKYQGDFINVFNLGVGGNTSEDLLKRFENEAFARKPTDFVFQIGNNDSGYFGVPVKPITEESKFALNLEELIAKASKFSPKITFIGLVLGDDSILQPFPGSSTNKAYSRERVKAYDKIVKDISEKNGCRFIEILDKLDFSDFQDGLHPNEQGHKKMFEVIKKYFYD